MSTSARLSPPEPFPFEDSLSSTSPRRSAFHAFCENSSRGSTAGTSQATQLGAAAEGASGVSSAAASGAGPRARPKAATRRRARGMDLECSRSRPGGPLDRARSRQRPLCEHDPRSRRHHARGANGPGPGAERADLGHQSESRQCWRHSARSPPPLSLPLRASPAPASGPGCRGARPPAPAARGRAARPARDRGGPSRAHGPRPARCPCPSRSARP